MSELDIIRKPVQLEINEFERHFKKAVKSKVPLLNVILNYLLRRKGKQIRPSLVLLTSSMLGEINEGSYTAASLIELLHTASLVHDDVVDESYERRGFFSLNAIWKSKISVLVGDYLLSQGLLLSVKHKRYDLLEIVSEAVREMSEGELLQLRKSRKLDITMDEYFDIIGKKTAALIAACTACGAQAVTDSKETVSRMKEFGYYLGIAFQIKDDLFDYNRNGLIGKPSANDIKEKKLTLPLIYALENCNNSEKRSIIRKLRKSKKSSAKVDEIISFVKKNGGLDYARKIMDEYKNKAIQILMEFPENESRNSLVKLVEYTVTRKK
jgi:octaprenyl-diphosphate synthase